MKNYKCETKKMIAWQRGLLFSVLVSLTLTPGLVAQGYIPSQVFASQGGAEIEYTDSRNIAEIIEHEGIDLDHGCTHEKLILYVTAEGYEYLREGGYAFNFLKRPAVRAKMKGPDEIFKYRSECLPVMDFYPTYEGYKAMMENFASSYPELCELISIGTLDSGKEILVMHIGDDVRSSDDEPNFLYTSSMHGDETAGYVVLLQLIDYLLCNYDNDERVRRLLDSINIYINPLANPDGTYAKSDTSVIGATRRNINLVDLHRNFPDPEDGPRPDNRPRQQETQYFMDFADDYNIDLSCNIHSGRELIAYPWDTWANSPADETWWIDVATDYIDSCMYYGPAGYMTGPGESVRNGYSWYEVNGGRQDHIMYFHRGREMTLEISNVKVLDSDQLPDIWNANRASLLNYMEESLYGLRGLITDCNTGNALKAEVMIPGYDKDNSSVFSDSLKGNYFRYLSAGNYDFRFIAEGYDTVDRTVTIIDKAVQIENIELCPMDGSATSQELWETMTILVNDTWIEFDAGPMSNTHMQLFSIDGQKVLEERTNKNRINIEHLNPGVYLLQLISKDYKYTRPLFIP